MKIWQLKSLFDNYQSFQLQQNLNDEKEVITATSYEDLNLTVASKITAQEIDSFIAKYHSDSPLVGHGQDFINAQNQYGVSAHYLAMRF